MNKYLLSIKRKTEALVLLKYDANAGLENVDIQTRELDAPQLTWILQIVPPLENGLALLPQAYPFLHIRPVPKDLGFNAFYEAYDNKVGKKERVIKLWTSLGEADRVAIFAAIPRYKAWLMDRPKMEMLYPETFLSQKRWQNDFK